MAQRLEFDSEAPSDSLCETCRDLAISPDKFTGDGATSRASNVDEHLDSIYRRKDRCSLCWLMFQATYSPDEDCNIGYDGLTKDGQRVDCHVEWRRIGKTWPEDDKHNPTTRRLLVYNSKDIFPPASITPLCEDVPGRCASPCFLGRKIPRDRVDLDTIRNWLHLCLEHHGEACNPRSTGRSDKSTTSKSLRLVDLQKKCLVTFEALGDVEYATLSYVWGSTPMTCLERDSVEKFSSPGSLDPNAAKLPNTVRDAMILVLSLGIRYLWVDSLCIVQGDREEWEYMAPLMGRIYGNSTVNICAAAGNGSHHGIPGTRLTHRGAVQSLVSLSGMTLSLVKHAESLIQSSKWSTRAWTFQERVLARRSLIFTEDCVFFQCHQATWLEDIHSESSLTIRTVDTEGSPFESLETSPVHTFLHYVQQYSGRELRFESDRLVAFAGLSSLLSPRLRARFLYGLPHSYFDFALLWNCKDVGTGDSSFRQFPTWSWCGWNGAVEWCSMVRSPLRNLHEWLTRHTWVIWYTYLDLEADRVSGAICPSDGVDVSRPQLQLVWQELGTSSRTPDRWHGYSSSSNIPYGRDPGLVNQGRPTYPTSTRFRNGWLYFWTHTAFFQLTRRGMTAPESASELAPGLKSFGILDNKGDRCGRIVLPASWLSKIGAIFEFAAISEAAPLPDEPYTDEWRLYHALLIVWDARHTVAERAGLTKINKEAFYTGSFEPKQGWREIALR